MPSATSKLRILAGLRLANAIVFSLAVATVVLDRVAPAEAVNIGFQALAGRDLVVVDRTGDRTWQRATKHAVAYWDSRRSGAAFKLRWETGDGPCVFEPDRIAVCRKTRDELNKDALVPIQGFAAQDAGKDGRSRSAVVEVCSDCRIDYDRKVVIAAHEIGHALGLPHNKMWDSVMYHGGGSEHPTQADYAALRSLYDHPAPERRNEACLISGWLRLGPLCI